MKFPITLNIYFCYWYLWQKSLKNTLTYRNAVFFLFWFVYLKFPLSCGECPLLKLKAYLLYAVVVSFIFSFFFFHLSFECQTITGQHRFYNFAVCFFSHSFFFAFDFLLRKPPTAFSITATILPIFLFSLRQYLLLRLQCISVFLVVVFFFFFYWRQKFYLFFK